MDLEIIEFVFTTLLLHDFLIFQILFFYRNSKSNREGS